MYRQADKKQHYLLHISSQYGERRPTNSWDLLASLGHCRKFQPVLRLGFVTPLTSLSGGQPNFAGCLAISWAGTPYIYIFGVLLPPNGFLPAAKFTLRPSLAFCYIGTALKQRSSAKLCCMVQGMELLNFHRGHHLYSAGRPSHLASVHILVANYLLFVNYIDSFVTVEFRFDIEVCMSNKK